jgi:transcriptional regulator with XRE-family HTH domain
MDKPLSQILRSARQEKGISLAQLAKLSGLESTTCWRIETGKTDPRIDTQLLPLLNHLGLQVAIYPIHRTSTSKKGNK